MKLLFLLLVALVVLFALACAADTEAAARVAHAWNAAIEDGTVTKAEAEAFVALIREDWPASTDWKELLTTGIASVAASFFGINLYRNRRNGNGTNGAPALPVIP
jgi:hypothetical protein